MNNDNNSLALSLINSIASPKTYELLADGGEVFIDSIMKDGILKDIPVFGSLSKIYSIGVAVRDVLFVRKLQKFLKNLEMVSYEDRQKFVTDINLDPDLRIKVGENLLLLIDQVDDIQKPELIAKAFKAYIEKRISYEDFSKIGSAISRVYLSDLIKLHKTGTIEEGAELASLGIMNASVPTYPGESPRN